MVLTQVTIWSLYGLGEISLEAAIAGAVLALALPLAILWNIRASGHGIVKLTPRGVVVEMGAGRQKYTWQDVADVQLDTYQGRLPLGTLQSGGAEPVVRITLTRSLQLGFLPGQFGTDIAGLPSLALKSVRLRVENPEGFVSAVHDFLANGKP